MLTDQQIIDLNPINQKLFTDEQIAILQNLTNEELKQLATAYPASAGNPPFLVLHDSGKKVQNGAKATYATLYNLRVKNGQGHFSISTVVSKYTKTTGAPAIVKGMNNKPDLTAKDLLDAPGIKRGGVKEAKPVDVTKKPADATSPLLTGPESGNTEEGGEENEKEFENMDDQAGKLADKVLENGGPVQNGTGEGELPEKPADGPVVEFKPYTQRNKTELLAEIALRPNLQAPDGAKNKELVDLLVKDDAAKK